MPNRTLFNKKQIKPFTAWMESNGWQLETSTNEYEILRFLKLDKTLEIASFYKKKNADCLTLSGRTAELYTDYLRGDKS